MLTTDVVSFEQLGPGMQIFKSKYSTQMELFSRSGGGSTEPLYTLWIRTWLRNENVLIFHMFRDIKFANELIPFSDVRWWWLRVLCLFWHK